MDDTDALLDAMDEAHRHLERKLAPRPKPDAPSGWAVLEILAEAGRKRQCAAALRQADHLIEAAAQLESFAAAPQAAPEACVRATLRRDAKGVFGILLKRGEGGVYIARLQQSEAADERALLHEGDLVRRVDGQAIHDLEEAKRLVRQAGGAVTLEVAARRGLPALLDGIGSSLGGLLGELMEKPQVRETRDKVGQQIKRLIETGRDNLEESHHSLQQLGEDVKRKAREVQTNLHGLHAGIAGFAHELLQHPPHGQSSGRRAMPWHCTACTYDNFVCTHACEMCETARERSDAAAADGAVGGVLPRVGEGGCGGGRGGLGVVVEALVVAVVVDAADSLLEEVEEGFAVEEVVVMVITLGAAARPLCSDWAAEAYALPSLGAAAAEAPPLCSPLEAMRGGATEETQLARVVELSPRLPQPIGGEPRAADGATPPLEVRPQQQA
ncbi:hypothetical protein AB1Y20_012270 [Prymnesium parvum]|uniref:RanBP2-type domain-containing protein n=1 Tax=Prymnesium parvum TaxID=97485 RepID=A0AB34INM2_PRYPA